MSEKKKEREGERERWGNVKESKREREGERLEAKIMVAFDNFFWSELISRLKVFFLRRQKNWVSFCRQNFDLLKIKQQQQLQQQQQQQQQQLQRQHQ